ncbi:hypothetical protein [Marinibactrum halimedae]|uniref:Uncharacterized protein n=1 Tax=Marinibactrum halimedae TaxID=1444977 RepID=A0AA37WP24_9GAMM|nr:hypothetical protein [Marinibactrum halimedae]MCD9461331.1 hypothetical protein [Marinibactrum halimedae]GLS28068.1 hypothetical protein GCM10007877_37870 [Marinibactrum halimedae]
MISELHMDEEGEVQSYLHEVEVDKKGLLITKSVKEINYSIEENKPTHFAITGNLDNIRQIAQLAKNSIDRGFGSYQIGSPGDTFYLLAVPESSDEKGFAKLLDKRFHKGAQQLAQVIGASQSHTNKVLSKRSRRIHPDLNREHGDKVKKQMAKSNTNFGDKASAHNTLMNAQALPDPIVCWTAVGKGCKVFHEALETANNRWNLDFHKTHHVYFSGSVGVGINTANNELQKAGMDWCATGPQVNRANPRQLFWNFFEEARLLKARTEVVAVEGEGSTAKLSAPIHPAFHQATPQGKRDAIEKKDPSTNIKKAAFGVGKAMMAAAPAKGITSFAATQAGLGNTNKAAELAYKNMDELMKTPEGQAMLKEMIQSMHNSSTEVAKLMDLIQHFGVTGNTVVDVLSFAAAGLGAAVTYRVIDKVGFQQKTEKARYMFKALFDPRADMLDPTLTPADALGKLT